MSKVLAILCADIHLSHKPPVARSAEPDWYRAMTRPLNQLRDLAEKHEVPIICAGDIFHRYNPPPELINFALQYLPEMWAVPGQHDIPLHDLNQLNRSAFHTLVEAERIEMIGGIGTYLEDLSLYGFSFGEKVEFWSSGESAERMKVAVIHSYIWMKTYGNYPGVPEENHINSFIDRLKGYNVAVFGDNHIGFRGVAGDCYVYNCGCLIPRTIKEKDYKPGVGLLWDYGRVTTHFLDTSEDKWIEAEEVEERESAGLKEFVDELEKLGVGELDFRETLERLIETHDFNQMVKSILLGCLEGTG